MADLCHQCALDIFGEDIGDLAGLSTPDDTATRRYPIALCEGCGPIQVDHTGRRVEGGDETDEPAVVQCSVCEGCYGECCMHVAV